ncbi:MAG TPA: hypothetical protein VIM70_20425 [Clostridium sp.]|uniref:hypothetical protein n=1 Tax=Clostridium sp. TaxID=1506 RepID=UPI002F956050
MKIKVKSIIVVVFVVALCVTIGTPIITKININNEFNTRLSQCKEIIEDADTHLSTEQITFIEDFEKKHYINGNYDSQFATKFIPYLRIKMKERITLDDVDAVDKLIVVSRLITINTKSDLDSLRLKLIDKKNELSPPPYVEETSPKTSGASVFKQSDNASSKPVQSSEPTIGMTSDEARASEWGNPNSINKTVTASGTDEQWVYDNNEYVYIKNGIVTAIQTH